jgi:hypothetical protein
LSYKHVSSKIREEMGIFDLIRDSLFPYKITKDLGIDLLNRSVSRSSIENLSPDKNENNEKDGMYMKL